METPMLESLFYKVAGFQAFFREICEIFNNTYVEEYLRTATSEKYN